jgi:hypothetical protein
MRYKLELTNNGNIQAYGGARDFVNYRGPEALLHGPAETGKTFTTLWKLNLCACKYPGASIVCARKVLNDIYSSIWATLKDKILGHESEAWPCIPYGGLDRPDKLNYHNGSILWLAGFDRAGKVLSAEHDIIYINQAEECTLNDWETATTRTTGRAGHMPYAQTIGDVNPAWPAHWMYHRDSLRMFYSNHRENPMLYDQATGAITAQGLRTMAVLDALTGVRRDRLRDGKPSQAEGAIYTEYAEERHLIYSTAIVSAFVRYICGVDWGFRNPGVMGVFGITGDSSMYRVAEIYRTNETDDWWLLRALELDREFGIEAFVCDPSEPVYIEKFKRAGLNAVGGFNAVLPGINAVQRRFQESGLFFVRDANRYVDEQLRRDKRPWRTEDEIPGYVWASNKTREQPVKENDHGCDAVRYAVAYVDRLDRTGADRAAAAPPVDVSSGIRIVRKR